ncbi:hypothetical protein QE152_g37 [Popillia japonica]|uniref:Gustatory receptor n=1 Tax=Popillia japonica TaxID=7064 RepID=A0AAW1NKV9_POPJA
MEGSPFIKLKHFCISLVFVGLAPFYFDEENNIIYSTFYIKIVFAVEFLITVTCVGIFFEFADMEREASVSTVLLYILLGVFLLKVIIRNVKGIFYNRSIYLMWIQIRETMELCNKHDLRYFSFAMLYWTLFNMVVVTLAPPILNTLIYILSNQKTSDFISISSIYLVNTSYLVAGQEFCLLIHLMSEYFGKLDLILKELTKDSGLIVVKDENIEEIKTVFRCYFSICEAVRKIAANFVMPAIVMIGETMMGFIFHSHNLMLLF